MFYFKNVFDRPPEIFCRRHVAQTSSHSSRNIPQHVFVFMTRHVLSANFVVTAASFMCEIVTPKMPEIKFGCKKE